MSKLCTDRKIWNPKESAVPWQCGDERLNGFFWNSAYLNIMKPMIFENLFPCTFCFCLRCEDNHGLHILWSTQLCKFTGDVVKVWVKNQALWTWVVSSSSTASAEIGCFFCILRFNQDTRVQHAGDAVCAEVSVSIVRAMSEAAKHFLKNLLINFILEPREFFLLRRWSARWIWWIWNLELLWETSWERALNIPWACIQEALHHHFQMRFLSDVGAMQPEAP